MTAAQDLVTALDNADLLNHLSDEERTHLNSRSHDLVFNHSYEIIDFLDEIPALIWFFGRDIPTSSSYTQKQLMFITHLKNTQDNVMQPDPLQDVFAHINTLNESLQRRRQPYRYYLLLTPDDYRLDPNNRYAVIFMDEDQRYQSDLHDYVNFSYSQPFTWTKRRAQDILHVLKETQLLNDIDDTVIKKRFRKILAEIESQATYLESNFLQKFDLLYSLDGEYYRAPEIEYQQLLTDLVTMIDDEQFKPIALNFARDDQDQSLKISFEVSDHHVEMFLVTFGWLDIEFFRILNRKLHDLGIDSQLYTLEPQETTLNLIYLSKSQYEQLRPYFSLRLVN